MSRISQTSNWSWTFFAVSYSKPALRGYCPPESIHCFDSSKTIFCWPFEQAAAAFFLARVFYGSMNVFKSGYIHEKSQKIRGKQSNRPAITKWLWKGIDRVFRLWTWVWTIIRTVSWIKKFENQTQSWLQVGHFEFYYSVSEYCLLIGSKVNI